MGRHACSSSSSNGVCLARQSFSNLVQTSRGGAGPQVRPPTRGAFRAATDATSVPESRLGARSGSTCPAITMQDLGEQRGRRLIGLVGEAPTAPSAARHDSPAPRARRAVLGLKSPAPCWRSCPVRRPALLSCHARRALSLLLASLCLRWAALGAHNTCLSSYQGPISSHTLAVQVGQGDDEFRMAAGPHLLGCSCV